MSETRNISRNTTTREGARETTTVGGPGRADTGLAGEVAAWGQVANAHTEASARSGLDAQLELNLRRNRSGQ